MRTAITLCIALLTSLSVYATQVTIVTNMGDIELELYSNKAPQTVRNFLGYVDSGFYENTIFHRVIPGFMAQGGGFTKDMVLKETNASIVYEGDNSLSNDRGTIAMARTADPDSATTQFFINFIHNTRLNHSASGPGYTVFGRVTKGMNIVDQMASQTTHSVGSHQDVPLTPIVIKRVTRS